MMKWVARIFIAISALLCASVASASIVSFDLTNSDKLPDGANYIRVTIDDEGVPGRINFHVSLLGPLRHQAGRRFGIEEFAFNSDFGISSRNIVGLPRHWKAGGSDKLHGFGRFDESVEAKNSRARVESLDFSIKGIKWDTIESYLDPSSGRAREGNFFFAVRVAGMDGDFRCITDATFGGGDMIPQLPTPLPGSTGLLLAGLGVLGVIAWRRRGTNGTRSMSNASMAAA